MVYGNFRAALAILVRGDRDLVRGNPIALMDQTSGRGNIQIMVETFDRPKWRARLSKAAAGTSLRLRRRECIATARQAVKVYATASRFAPKRFANLRSNVTNSAPTEVAS